MQLIVVPDAIGFFLFSLSLVSHSTGICTCANFCEEDVVLSEDRLSGKKDNLFQMFSTTNF